MIIGGVEDLAQLDLPEYVKSALKTYIDIKREDEILTFDPDSLKALIYKKTEDKPSGVTLKSQITDYLKQKKRMLTHKEKEELAKKLNTSITYINKVIKETWRYEQIGERKTKFQKLIELLRINPDMSEEKLARILQSSINSVKVMKQRAIREGYITEEEIIEKRKEIFEKKLNKLKNLLKTPKL